MYKSLIMATHRALGLDAMVVQTTELSNRFLESHGTEKLIFGRLDALELKCSLVRS